MKDDMGVCQFDLELSFFKDTLVSVVVPVYNTSEQCLWRCMASILAQTYGNIEVVVVDDGSDAVCAAALQTICSSDARVRLLRTSHAGVSAARNLGIAESRGEWLAFVDADDEVAPFFVEEALDLALSEDADLVSGRQARVYENSSPSPFARGESRCLCDEADLDLLRKQELAYDPCTAATAAQWFDHCGPCCRLYRLDLARSVSFPVDFAHGEDVLFVFEYLLRCSRVVLSDSIWYRYFQNAFSAVHDVDMDTRLRDLEAMRSLTLDAAYQNALLNHLQFVAFETAEGWLRSLGFLCGTKLTIRFWDAMGLRSVCQGLDPSEFQVSVNRKTLIRLIATGHPYAACVLFAGKRNLRSLLGRDKVLAIGS